MGEEVPFAQGSIYGERAWHLFTNGQLESVTSSYTWTPGENVAECGTSPKRRANTAGITYHQVASKTCQCGFYSYYNGKNDYAYGGLNITGIVENYGRVSYGSEGCRAEKSRIVALINPYLEEEGVIYEYVPPTRPRKVLSSYRKWTDNWLRSTSILWGTLILAYVLQWVGVFSSMTTTLTIGIVNVWYIATFGVYFFFDFRGYRKRNKELDEITVSLHNGNLHITGRILPEERYTDLMRAYPGVKWYSTMSAAKEDFPMRPPSNRSQWDSF